MKSIALLPLLLLGLLAAAQSPSAVPVKFGCLSGNCENGTGKLRFKDNNLYEGQWKNGKQEGKGKLTLVGGAFYQGDFIANLKDGKGVMQYKDGMVYTGDWVKDKRQGKGEIKDKNGAIIYSGDWAADTMMHPEQSSIAKKNVYNAFYLTLYTDNTRPGHYLMNSVGKDANALRTEIKDN